jgi:putative hydrolase
LIQQIAGLMSLLEGHGDVTMSRAVGDLVPSAARFSHVLQARRKRSNPLTRLMLRLTGIEGKLNQYAAGERFIAEIEDVGGPRAVDVCWRAPENLPSMEEIRNPQLWLDRIGALVG